MEKQVFVLHNDAQQDKIDFKCKNCSKATNTCVIYSLRHRTFTHAVLSFLSSSSTKASGQR